MNQHYMLRSLGLLLLATGCGWSCRQPESDRPADELASAWAERVEKPHIVLIVADTLRKDHLGCYGYDRPTSPHLDRLAASSLVYDNAFSQAPWTLPAVASLLTSRYPAELGIQGFNKRIPDEELFLPEILGENGYATHAIVSHSFVGAEWGFDQGFDTFQSFAGGHRTISSEQVTEAAIRAVQRFDQGPTFLLVHYFDPHFLYMEHPEYPVSGPAPQADSEWWLMPFSQLRAKAWKKELSQGQVEYLRTLYDSEIAFTDAQIGRLLAELEGRDHLDRSIVVFTADHGEQFMDHGGLGHTSTVYNELVNVPLLVRWPGQVHEVRSQRYVAHVDLVPTLLDYLGIPPSPAMSGVHWRHRDPGSAIFTETRRYQKVLGVISDGVKLVVNEKTGEERFFDLRADPAEQRSLQEHQEGGRLRAELEDYRRRARQGLARLEREVDIEISEEELERLRSLGYVD